MNSEQPRLQPLTRARVAELGAVGAAWHADLPARLSRLCARWSLTPGRALPGGSTSYVVRVATAGAGTAGAGTAGGGTAGGGTAVLKLSLPDPGLAAQAATLQRAAGRGYARLLEVDLDEGALLLEALGRSLSLASRPVEDQLRLLADTLALAWQQPSVDPAGPLDKAGGLAALVRRLWDAQDRPCPEAVVDRALEYAARRGTDPNGQPALVHGDPHPGNLLAAPHRSAEPGTGWCFVDPDGFVADRAYDLGVVLRDWCSELDGPDARRRLEGWCALLADRSGVDAARIWEWGYLERVSTGLYVRSFGADRVAEPFLRTAALLL